MATAQRKTMACNRERSKLLKFGLTCNVPNLKRTCPNILQGARPESTCQILAIFSILRRDKSLIFGIWYLTICKTFEVKYFCDPTTEQVSASKYYHFWSLLAVVQCSSVGTSELSTPNFDFSYASTIAHNYKINL